MSQSLQAFQSIVRAETSTESLEYQTKLNVEDLRVPSMFQRAGRISKNGGNSLLILAVYVDDLFVTGSSLTLINEFKKEMAKRFDMSDLGRLTYYLGIEVSQGTSGIKIKQEAYAWKILKEAGMYE
jgi:hypothetical protein